MQGKNYFFSKKFKSPLNTLLQPKKPISAAKNKPGTNFLGPPQPLF
jgi:hypothetical protein